MIRRLVWALIVLIVLAGVGAAGYTIRAAVAPEPATLPTVPTATATVVRTDLVQTETLSGTLEYARPRQIRTASPGTITALPAQADRLGRGSVAFEIDGEPVVVLSGERPAWRPLSDGVDDGADVLQLEENLAALGYGPEGWEPDEAYDGETADAVEEWRADLGLPDASVVESGRVVFLPEDMRVGAVAVEVGSPVAAGAPVFEATSFEQQVTIDLDPDDIDLVAPGAMVEIELPDGRRLTGRVAAVGRAVEPAGPDPGSPGVIEVRVALDAPVPDLDRAPVEVDLESDRASDVLAVPVRALIALSDGGYAVEMAGGALVQVDTGDFAGGLVEVSGAIEEGDEVVVPR